MNSHKPILNDCGCDIFIPFVYQTYFLRFPICYTIMCVHCRKKVKARNMNKAIEKWNKNMGENNK